MDVGGFCEIIKVRPTYLVGPVLAPKPPVDVVAHSLERLVEVEPIWCAAEIGQDVADNIIESSFPQPGDLRHGRRRYGSAVTRECHRGKMNLRSIFKESGAEDCCSSVPVTIRHSAIGGTRTQRLAFRVHYEENAIQMVHDTLRCIEDLGGFI